jgi:NADH:ubiquinone oxidoreductase subunit F (NADH-binding)
VNRILPPEPYGSIDDYLAAGGGLGLAAARALPADVIIDEVRASGLRGRGGGGFPTGEKWRAVKSFESPLLHTSVVVNAAEGEPGTFKDRAIMRSNPYAVIEGALIAAHAVDAKSVIIATKASFEPELGRIRTAVAEATSIGWCDDVVVEVVEGPSDYLFGEETAMLEVIDGRPPFPRIAPPFRRGVVEVVGSQRDAESGSGLPADMRMAGEHGHSAAPPVLVNNVETMANVALIVARGAQWFREIGTDDSPGTILCTFTGAVQRPGVIEVAMGTTLRAAIELAGGVSPGCVIAAVMVGVSSAVVTADQLDTPLTYGSMSAIGSGLGSAGFVVLGDDIEPVAVAAGVAHFLAVESCGQCTHCKEDGADIARLLAKVVAGQGVQLDLDTVAIRLSTVADGARCSLAAQQQTVVGSLLRSFPDRLQSRILPGSPPVESYMVAPLADIGADGAVVDTSAAGKQPDWTHDAVDSGKAPVDRFSDHRVDVGG